MRWLVFALFVLVVSAGYAAGVAVHGTFTSVMTVSTAKRSIGIYDTLCGYELFFWRVYGDTVFGENYFVLRKYYACRPVSIRATAPVDSMLVSYYKSLFSAGGSVESYLAMRDYPVVYRVDGSVPSPIFNPIVYARFEGGLRKKNGGKVVFVDLWSRAGG